MEKISVAICEYFIVSDVGRIFYTDVLGYSNVLLQQSNNR
jgi:hypothetical protein